jgi:hypothetical protein
VSVGGYTPQPVMDKMQADYEALQQKLALLRKPDPNAPPAAAGAGAGAAAGAPPRPAAAPLQPSSSSQLNKAAPPASAAAAADHKLPTLLKPPTLLAPPGAAGRGGAAGGPQLLAPPRQAPPPSHLARAPAANSPDSGGLENAAGDLDVTMAIPLEEQAAAAAATIDLAAEMAAAAAGSNDPEAPADAAAVAALRRLPERFPESRVAEAAAQLFSLSAAAEAAAAAAGGGACAAAGEDAAPSATTPVDEAAVAALGSEPLLRACERALAAAALTSSSSSASSSAAAATLRRCLRLLMQRAAQVVERGAEAERAALHEARGEAALDQHAELRRLEAEVAVARKAAAQAEATYRGERAAWLTALDVAKFEAGRVSREAEAVEAQRDRAREDLKRSETQRAALESELKELRKLSSAQLRESRAEQGERARMLEQERAAGERREAALREEVGLLKAEAAAAAARAEQLEARAQELQQGGAALREALSGKAAAEAALSQEASALQAKLAESQRALEEAQAATRELASGLAATKEEVATLSKAKEELEKRAAELEAERETGAADAERAAAAAAERERGLAAELDEARRSGQEHASAAEAGEAARAAAERAAQEAAAKLEKAEQAAAEAAASLSEREAEAEALRASRDALEREAPTLRQAAQEARDALDAARQESAAGAERLATLEAEFEALREAVGEAAGPGGGGREVVSRLLGRISLLQRAAADAEATRRRLHNQLVELKGNIRVFCRVRPFGGPGPGAVRCLGNGTGVAVLAPDGREHSFEFDKVFSPASTQAQVFDAVSELVQSALDGYHVCLFSYGQTGAGKTYTMQGGGIGEGEDGTAGDDQRGIIPRAVEQILATAARLEAQSGGVGVGGSNGSGADNATEGWRYELSAACVEVYNSELRDLLGSGARIPEAGAGATGAIKHDPTGGHTLVAGATRAPISDAASAAALVRRAAVARATGSTAMNAGSSRSHSVFMLYVSGTHAPTQTRLRGSLCLVDLAGSERLDRSLAEHGRKKEACAINASLSALGDVLSALKAKQAHVPYRNSKLTYLLQPCLGGSGKTLMLVNVNPEPPSAGETLCSLRFAATANAVDNNQKGGNGGGGAKRNVEQLGGGGGEGGGAKRARA